MKTRVSLLCILNGGKVKKAPKFFQDRQHGTKATDIRVEGPTRLSAVDLLTLLVFVAIRVLKNHFCWSEIVQIPLTN